VTPAGGGLRVLVLGGSRSGKSRSAEDYLGLDGHVTYVATAAGYPGDADWPARVERHRRRRRRPDAWATVETADPAEFLVSGNAGPVVKEPR
jgi:adenosylcobinamide kinase/adenosylcobinamide-phosphate guanylyltransferase